LTFVEPYRLSAAYEPKWYLSDIPYQDLTHLWYSFIYLRTDGGIEVGDPDIDLYGLTGTFLLTSLEPPTMKRTKHTTPLLLD
jgi:GH18 family chitinase